MRLSKEKVKGLEWPEPNQVRRYVGMARDQFDLREKEHESTGLSGFKTWFKGTQIAPRQFEVDVNQFNTIAKNLLDTTADSGKKGTQDDRSMHYAGWFYALSTTERDIYQNSVAAVWETMNTVAEEGYESKKAGHVILTDRQHSEVMESINAAIDGLSRLRDETVSVRFRRGGFEVIQSSRVTDDLAIRMLRRFDLMMGALTEFGCGHLLYGRVIITDNIGEGKWSGRGATRGKRFDVAAHYIGGPDEIQMGQHVTTGRPDFSTAVLVHEMGHRHWFKAMDESDRVAFNDAVMLPDGSFVSPTKYGQKNVAECFAEWFMVYASGYRGKDVQIHYLEKGGAMSRSIFRKLCKLDSDQRLDDYIPGFAKDAVLMELLRLDETIKTYLVTLMEVPEFIQVREVIHEADGLVDARLINTATNFARNVIPTIAANFDGKYPKLVEPYNEIQDLLISRGLKGGVIDSAIRIYCSKSISSGKWPEPDPKLLVSREDLEVAFRDEGGDEFDDEAGSRHFDLRKHRTNLTQKGVTHHGDLTIKIVPREDDDGFTLERTKAGVRHIYDKKLSLDHAQKFALSELRKLISDEAGKANIEIPQGIMGAKLDPDMTARNLSTPAGVAMATSHFGGSRDTRLIFWNKKRDDLRLTGDADNDHRYFRSRQKGSGRWEGAAFKLRKGDLVYAKTDPGLVFYKVKSDFNPQITPMQNFILYLVRVGVVWVSVGRTYVGHAAAQDTVPQSKPKPQRGRGSKAGGTKLIQKPKGLKTTPKKPQPNAKTRRHKPKPVLDDDGFEDE